MHCLFLSFPVYRGWIKEARCFYLKLIHFFSYKNFYSLITSHPHLLSYERITWKQVYYQGWNRSPAQVGCMRQVLRAGALGRPRGMGWRGRRKGGSGWGTHVNPWLIHVNVWQKSLQYCKVIRLQLIKINETKTHLHKMMSELSKSIW